MVLHLVYNDNFTHLYYLYLIFDFKYLNYFKLNHFKSNQSDQIFQIFDLLYCQPSYKRAILFIVGKSEYRFGLQ